MSFLSLHYLPRNVKEDADWEKYVVRMKPLRLRSLKEDAASFVSKYEVEVNEPLSFWIGRLKDPKAWSIVMVQSSEELARDDDVLLREDVKWVAFCVMIDPRECDQKEAGVSISKEQSAEYPDWHMAAVWLSPELRGQGAGRRLVQYGLDVARQVDCQNEIRGRCCNTQVVKGNDGALELYRKIGFQIVDSYSTIEKGGILYHSTELKIEL